MSQRAILVMGLPASGKSSITEQWKQLGFEVFNRDSVGGKVASLADPFLKSLKNGKSVVADNTFLTVESRAPFIAAAKEAGVPIECHWMTTSFDDCQVNACTRMYERYGQVFLDNAQLKAHSEASKDPNMFPVAALFAAKKRLNGDKKKGIPSGKPTKDEGFSKVVKVKFERRPSKGKRKAIILDYDGTLRADAREHGGEFAYPVKPGEVVLLPNRTETIRRLLASGEYDLVLGITTQSGIGKGVVSEADVLSCINETDSQLNVEIERTYHCPHYNFPVSCYCRKPQVGLGVAAIMDFDLDPAESIYVGDQTSDKTFAKRCGFKFAHADDFFKE